MMQPPVPFVRAAGAGMPVVCIHASASSSSQWRALTDRLADRYRIIAPDLYGSGKTAPWQQDRRLQLDDEVTLLRPVLDAAGERFHLVGHSYGGAVALKMALAYPERLLSLVVYEPVLFGILMAEAPQSAAAHEIMGVRDDTIRFVDQGDLDASAERFVDYWMGKGAWAATPEFRRPAIAGAMRAVKHEWQALFHELAALKTFGAISTPTCLLTGTSSRVPARSIVRLLAKTLPQMRVEEIEGAGHMAPVTNPEQVNPLIETFLEANYRPRAD
jgi:pimeloyl-ACP methyl ester carboxylesterase